MSAPTRTPTITDKPRRGWPPELVPKLLTTLREGYTAADFARDALAGVIVGIVALPLAIAFAIASGVRPEQGLYTAIVAGFVISALGGSRVQIGGPTGAFVVLVAGVVAEHGYEGLAIATIMAGCLLVVMAVARLGDVIRFVPYPVTVGFTSGIAVIIALGQLREAFGLDSTGAPTEFVERTLFHLRHLGSAEPSTALVFVATIVVIQLWPRVGSRVPGPLVALLGATAFVQLAGLDSVATIGVRFGVIPGDLPSIRIPHVDWNTVPDLISPAVSIALLGGIESLLSAVVADGLVSGRHRSNAELFAQGVANIASPLFGGIPATGAIARTATNVRNGGRTPIAGIVHAATLLVILLVAGPWASAIPMAALAGILAVVAYNMSEWRAFVGLLSAPRSDVLVLVTTFLLTIIIDLAVAIQVGVVLAALLFMRRMAEVTSVRAVRGFLDYETDDRSDRETIDTLAELQADMPEDIAAFEINGPFCFGAAREFTETLLAIQGAPRVVILRMRNVSAMDATGLHALEDVFARLAGRGVRLLLTGVHTQPLKALQQSGAAERIGRENIVASFPAALARARETAVAPEAAGARPIDPGNETGNDPGNETDR